MKKLLATSAIVLVSMSSGAFAQALNTGADANQTVVDDNTNVNATASLLTQILNKAADVQISMTNAAENLANLDGSINVLESANVDELLAEITSSTGFGDGQELYIWELPDGTVVTGTQAEYETAAALPANTVYTWDADGTGSGTATSSGTLAQYQAAIATTPSIATQTPTISSVNLVEVNKNTDTFAGLLKGVTQTVDGTTAIDFYDPAATVDALQTNVSKLTTTVIGALNTGVIGSKDAGGGIAANTLNMANMKLESVAQTTGSMANSAQYFEPGDLQLANLATNMATVVDASVNVDQLMANVDTVSTTLIGALNTGDIATDVNQNASNISAALIGQ